MDLILHYFVIDRMTYSGLVKLDLIVFGQTLLRLGVKSDSVWDCPLAL